MVWTSGEPIGSYYDRADSALCPAIVPELSQHANDLLHKVQLNDFR